MPDNACEGLPGWLIGKFGLQEWQKSEGEGAVATVTELPMVVKKSATCNKICLHSLWLKIAQVIRWRNRLQLPCAAA